MVPVFCDWKILCLITFLQEALAKTPVLLFSFQCNRDQKKSLRSNAFSLKLNTFLNLYN